MPNTKTSTRQRQRVKIDEPMPRYKVIMHNDDVTTMDFVVEVLRTVFFMDTDAAAALMMKIHNEGSGVVGVYDYDIAMSKVFKVKQMAAEQQFPLKLTVEKE
ncbi:MAG: ATP-dependent Clp protease adaptor ClpS [Bacteroidales bacterium]|nr:ATP-dependent Clp protease adaptor ClpS [Bacteroidales bacterium]